MSRTNYAPSYLGGARPPHCPRDGRYSSLSQLPHDYRVDAGVPAVGIVPADGVSFGSWSARWEALGVRSPADFDTQLSALLERWRSSRPHWEMRALRSSASDCTDESRRCGGCAVFRLSPFSTISGVLHPAGRLRDQPPFNSTSFRHERAVSVGRHRSQCGLAPVPCKSRRCSPVHVIGPGQVCAVRPAAVKDVLLLVLASRAYSRKRHEKHVPSKEKRL